MSQTVAIILRFDPQHVEAFESSFQHEVMPLWEEFKSQGRFIAASLTRAVDGSEEREGIVHYILHVEVDGMDTHNLFDSDPRFMAFLGKAKQMQPEEPLVWFGDTRFQV